MDLTFIKYTKIDKPNVSIVMAVSDCDELYRIEKVYRNSLYDESFNIGRLLDIREDKLYQNKVVLGNIEKVELDNSILELVKTQIQLQQDINRKNIKLKQIDDLLLNNYIFTNSVY